MYSKDLLSLFVKQYYIGNHNNTGVELRWRTSGGVGPSKHLANDTVGWVSKGGYRETKIKVNGIKVTLKCHRIVMSLILGRLLLDSETVDHIDGNKLNNNPTNLRIVTMSQNALNKHHSRVDSNNKLIGVSRLRSGKWRARLQSTSPSNRHIGCYNTAKDACFAYWTAKKLVDTSIHDEMVLIENAQLEIAHKLDTESEYEIH